MKPFAEAAADMAQHAVEHGDPMAAITHLLSACVSRTDAATGRVYLLNLAASSFVTVAQIGRDDDASPIPVAVSGLHDEPHENFYDVLTHGVTVYIPDVARDPRSRRHSAGASSRLVVPMMCEGACVGLVDVDSRNVDHFSDDARNIVTLGSALMVSLSEHSRTLRTVRSLTLPISFSHAFAEFLREVLALVAVASDMPYVVIREVEEGALRCLASFGFGERSNAELDIEDCQGAPPFLMAITEGRTAVVGNLLPVSAELRPLQPEAAVLRSIVVVPIHVDGAVFGTLSLGASCPHHYTQSELSCLEVVAAFVGLAIVNYRNAHRATEAIFDQAKRSVEITIVEVAQAARHEARSHLDMAQSLLTVLSSQSDNAAKRDERIAQISGSLRDVMGSLEKIRPGMHPAEEPIMASLKGTFVEVLNLFAGRFEHDRIAWKVVGPDATIPVLPDYWRTALVNLILNSVEAFRIGKRRGRWIRIATVIEDGPPRSAVIRYSDNALGIDVASLRPPVSTERGVDEIFEHGVTSKDAGAGFGLYLVRSIVRRHRGSIRITEYRRGVTFEIRVPIAV